MGPTTAAPQSLRATGTYDSSPTKDPPQIPQQSARETVQSEATRRDAHHRSGHQGEKRKSFKIAEKRNATRHNAPPSVKATSGIRTLDLRFTKAPLENESDDTASTYNGANQNPSTIPSSQAQETRVSEPYLTSIEQALGELPSVERNAVAQHINALATMSKKRRHAILTLTEEET